MEINTVSKYVSKSNGVKTWILGKEKTYHIYLNARWGFFSPFNKGKNPLPCIWVGQQGAAAVLAPTWDQGQNQSCSPYHLCTPLPTTLQPLPPTPLPSLLPSQSHYPTITACHWKEKKNCFRFSNLGFFFLLVLITRFTKLKRFFHYLIKALLLLVNPQSNGSLVGMK